jgi:transcriptional regulator GlxA family with amidase domain
MAEGLLGVGLDIVETAAGLSARGMAGPGRPAALLRQRVVSPDGQPVRASNGRSVAVDGAFHPRALRAGDVLVLPGIAKAATLSGLDLLLARAETQRISAQIARLVRRGVLVAASCSATFVLAAGGALDGRQATTTWWLSPVFARRFPAVTLCPDRMVVDSDGILTAGAAFAHADLLLAVVARLAGPSLAQLVTRYLVLDGRDSQARYMVLEHLRSADPMLQAVERFVRQNLDRQIALAELAQAAATSPRTLARRIHAAVGLTPQRLVQRIRIAQAAHLLETTRESVEQIAARVGYADAAAFRRVYRQHFGEAPRKARPRRITAQRAH